MEGVVNGDKDPMDMARALAHTVHHLEIVERSMFARASDPERAFLSAILRQIASHLDTVARPDKKHLIEPAAGRLLGAARSAFEGGRSWFRKAGSRSAAKKLSQIAALMKELKHQIDELPLEAMDALHDVIRANDENSTTITKRELSPEYELDLCNNLAAFIMEVPICDLLDARRNEIAVRQARRIPHARELSETVLPRTIWAVGAAEQHLNKNPSPAGRPPAIQKRMLTKFAAETYEELSGRSADNSTKAPANIPPFSEFLDRLLPLLGMASKYERKDKQSGAVMASGSGGKSQTKKWRAESNKGRK